MVPRHHLPNWQQSRGSPLPGGGTKVARSSQWVRTNYGYRTQKVEVKTEKGVMAAVVYIFSNPDDFEGGDWDKNNFEKTKLK